MLRCTDEVYGLSPRVRGNPAHSPQQFILGGSIPACAGEPAGPVITNYEVTVYPRVCGGTLDAFGRSSKGSGLSPRVRGNRENRRSAGGSGRSIPACAGEPTSGGAQAVNLTVYPRVCGGTDYTRPQPWRCWGLSPRVRGNHHRNGAVGARRGSIPACAGEPAFHKSIELLCLLYPRVCGGTRPISIICVVIDGLSPRVRGNQNR